MFANNIKGALSYIHPKISQLTLRNVFSISFSGVGSLSLDHPYMMVILIMTFKYQLYKGPKKAYNLVDMQKAPKLSSRWWLVSGAIRPFHKSKQEHRGTSMLNHKRILQNTHANSLTHGETARNPEILKTSSEDAIAISRI